MVREYRSLVSPLTCFFGSEPRSPAPASSCPPAPYRSGTPLELLEPSGTAARDPSCRRLRWEGILGFRRDVSFYAIPRKLYIRSTR